MEQHKLNQNVRRMERGQSLVEMSIGLVLVVLIISGILDLGRIYYIYVALEDAAAEAAIFLSIHPECPTATSSAQCIGTMNAEYRARNSGGNFVSWTNTTIETILPPDGFVDVGEPVTVKIRYTFPLLTPFIPRIAGVNPITLEATATQIIISEGTTL